MVDRDWQSKINIIKNTYEDGEERRRKLIEVYNERDSIKEYIKKEAKKVMNDYFKNWRGITSNDIYINLFKDDELFEIATANRIPRDLAAYIKRETIKNFENGIIDEDDLAPLLYIHMILEGIEEKEKYKHIVVDEVQDYSPLQILLINSLTKGNSLTLVGDLAQGIYYYKGISKWEDITEGVFEGKATYMALSQSYRSTIEIIRFANGALEAQNLGLNKTKPVLRHGKEPVIKYTSSKRESVMEIYNVVEEIRKEGKHSIAIITKTFKEAKVLEKDIKRYTNLEYTIIKGNEKSAPSTDVVIIPVYLTKGLEFDGTIIYNPLESVYENNLLNQRLLYVGLTRALHYEYIIAEGKLSQNIKTN